MNEERIVLIRGNNSEWFEQAIFILKSPVAAKSKNLVLEAERIINEYMTATSAGNLSPKLERYKKSVCERLEAKQMEIKQMEAQKLAGLPVPAKTIPRNASSRHVFRPDYGTIFIGACLIVSCILFGFIMNGILAP